MRQDRHNGIHQPLRRTRRTRPNIRRLRHSHHRQGATILFLAANDHQGINRRVNSRTQIRHRTSHRVEFTNHHQIRLARNKRFSKRRGMNHQIMTRHTITSNRQFATLRSRIRRQIMGHHRLIFQSHTLGRHRTQGANLNTTIFDLNNRKSGLV